MGRARGRGRGRGRARKSAGASRESAMSDTTEESVNVSPPEPKKRAREDAEHEEPMNETIPVRGGAPNASSGNRDQVGEVGEKPEDEMDVDDEKSPIKEEETEVVASSAGPALNSTPKTRRSTRKSSTVDIDHEQVVIPLETRRSSRQKQPPKDNYAMSLAEQNQKPKPATRGRGGGRGGGRMKNSDKIWTYEYLTTNPDSPMASCDPSKIISEDVWNLLDDEEKAYCMEAVYESDKVYETTDPADIGKPDEKKATLRPDFWTNNPALKEGFRNYQENLANGRYEPKFVAAATEARERRMAGEFDDFKDRNFEEFWGQKQKLASDSIAGETSKIKIQALVEHKMLRVGDVFSMRRPFQGGLVIAKEAKLTNVNPKDHSMTFCFPPKDKQYVNEADPDNLVIEGVLSIGALETRLLQEHSQCPKRIPNGNAFKTFRIIRNQEDIGAIFDVRSEFYQKYLAPKE